jgi:hypothetical protein
LLVRVARPLRLQVPGGIYHVRARGNSRAAVYRDDRDRRVFLELFERVVDRFRNFRSGFCADVLGMLGSGLALTHA